MWKELHMSLVQWAASPEAIRALRKEQLRQIDLEAFEDPIELVCYLNHKIVTTEDLERKDRIYAALITTTQRQGSRDRLAATLLWLGLWPALDAMRNRLFRFYNDPEELVSEISAKFTGAVHKANLSRINRVAATLVRNVQRDILTGLKRLWQDQKRYWQMRREMAVLSAEAWGDSRWGLPYYLDPDEEIRALRMVLAKEVDSEAHADLVIWKAVHGETAVEVGKRLGLPSATVQKRSQRAFTRTRTVLAKSEEGLSPLQLQRCA
jgi:RNA polymerase sigma-70 factor (ECF subfamily)